MHLLPMIKQLVLCLLVLASCSPKTSTSTSNNTDKSTPAESVPVVDYEKEGYVSAYVKDMRALDGCDHLLVLDSGKKLQPTKLEEDFKRDNLKVWVKYSVSKGLAGICMSGTIVNLSAIEKRQ